MNNLLRSQALRAMVQTGFTPSFITFMCNFIRCMAVPLFVFIRKTIIDILYDSVNHN